MIDQTRFRVGDRVWWEQRGTESKIVVSVIDEITDDAIFVCDPEFLFLRLNLAHGISLFHTKREAQNHVLNKKQKVIDQLENETAKLKQELFALRIQFTNNMDK